MDPTEFCYWLRGFLEMADPKEMNEAQMKMLKKHLELVFVDVTNELEPIPEQNQEPKKSLLTDMAKTRIPSIHERMYCSATFDSDKRVC